MISGLLYTFFLLFYANFAVSDDGVCDLSSGTPCARVQLPIAPSYFHSVHPSGKYSAIIGSGISNYNVTAVPLNGCMQEDDNSLENIPINCQYDGVWTPDGRFLTCPGAFYFVADKIDPKTGKQIGSQVKKLDDEDQSFHFRSGDYQSIGVLEEAEKSVTYRYLSDAGGASFIDIKVNKQSGELIEKGTEVQACNNLDISRNTPMISKDGNYLSVVTDGVTKIFKLEKSGECKEALDLGFPTGKVSFNMDSSEIAFHIDNFDTDSHYFSGVNSGNSRDIYSIKLIEENEGSLKIDSVDRLTFNSGKGKGTYYPRHTKNGEIIALTSDGSSYYVDTFKSSGGDLKSAFHYTGVDVCRESNAMEALGILWEKVCKKGFRKSDQKLISLSMKKEQCEQLVKKHWNKNMKSELNSTVELDDLLALCSEKEGNQKSSVKTRVSKVNKLKDYKSTPSAELVERSCSGCHGEGGTSNRPYVDFSNYDEISKSEVEVWLQRMVAPPNSKEVMPPKSHNSFSEDDRESIILYLKSFLKGEISYGDPYTSN